jgi:hypothetical protein
MSHRTRAARIEERRLAKIKSGRDSLKGNHPPDGKMWTSGMIMRSAGHLGMVSVKVARRLCGYRWTSPSREWR